MVLKLVMHVTDDKVVLLRTFFMCVNVFFEINDINILLASRSYSIYFNRNTQIFGKTQTQTLLKTQTQPVYTLAIKYQRTLAVPLRTLIIAHLKSRMAEANHS